MIATDVVRAWAPASLSNLGPGFDALGMALHGAGDVVEARRTDTSGVTIHSAGEGLPLDPSRNTAGRAALSVLSGHPSAGVELTIRKGIRPGSGLGSSAASAVAAAYAVARLLYGDADKEALVDAVLQGESAVSGAPHGDNVLPSLFGGFVLVLPSSPSVHRRIDVALPIHVAVVRPDLDILTRDARAMLPSTVPLTDAAHNASALAFMIDALRAGDLEAFGRAMETDRLVEPVRARLVPEYEAVRCAARAAGAAGCALSGSGPALFALAADRESAERVRRAMVDAAGSLGRRCSSFVSRLDREGARDAATGEPGEPV